MYYFNYSSGASIHWGYPLGGATFIGDPSTLCFRALLRLASARLSNDRKSSFSSADRQLGGFLSMEPSDSTSSSDITDTVTSSHFCFSDSPTKRLLRRSQSCMNKTHSYVLHIRDRFRISLRISDHLRILLYW